MKQKIINAFVSILKTLGPAGCASVGAIATFLVLVGPQLYSLFK